MLREYKQQARDDETSHIIFLFVSFQFYMNSRYFNALFISENLVSTGRKTVCFQNIFSYKHYTAGDKNGSSFLILNIFHGKISQMVIGIS